MKHGPKVNQRVEVAVKDDPNFPGTFISRIDDITDEYIKLSAPYSNGELVPLREGMSLEITYFHTTAIFSFDSTILKRLARPVAYIFISIPNEIVRIQRRDYVRVDTNLPMNYTEITDSHEDRPKSRQLNGVTRNLSGGGIFFTPIEIPKGLGVGSVLRVKLELPRNDKPIEAKVKVLRIDPAGPESPHAVRIAAIFTTISTQSRNAIMRYVFERQRELMNKGIK